MPSILNATTSSGLVTSADNSGSLQLATNNGTTAVTIDTSQNVGIGTTSPASKLAVLENTNGNSIFNLRNTNAGSSATSILALGNDGALNAAYIVLNSSTNTAGGSGNSLNITNGLNAPMTFGTNNTERMRINADGGIRTQPTGGGTLLEQFGCRAWVNFNGTGTVAIRSSGNVSSITDNGTGDYTVNFATAMPDANYSLQLSVGPSASGEYASQISIFSQTNSPYEQAPTTTTARFITRNTSFTFTDPKYLCVSVFR
jgi:hypothetical protein